tara:strand:+ start:1862 stop:2593 length:732 start_codon:yes stop_codon:yes gene_type:complete
MARLGNEMGQIKINVMDTETTGFPPKADIVEFAYTELFVDLNNEGITENLRVGDTHSILAKPTYPININALAVHHIRDDMLVNARPSSEVLAEMAELQCDYWAAHNVAFDSKFFNPEDTEWLCTLKIAQTLYPDAPAHKNQVLRYHLKLDHHMTESRTLPAHRAGPDTYVTAFLLAKMLASKKMTLAEMIVVSGSKVKVGKIPFGKYKGTVWSQVPKDYLRWLVKNSEDTEVVETAKFHLKGN